MAMHDDEIAVDFQGLQNVASELEEILRQVNEKLNALYDRTEKVVLAWEGEARDMFVDTLDKWDRAMQDLEGAQAWLHEVVVNGQINYGAAHRAVVSGWRGA
ncbi:WXG100 family type VII secretion target [Streptomyces sp. TRM70308]|uniref:WXG100 family type VII secretion target n=1 Tax=Streptomyces TaxID=1883 RepID=UPI002248CF15|nr:WXG100 family type VII secretion target [Streptomyces sp. JHD 1]MCX2971830.1 WXG100 family type VII secretion target [Streptomyces sp. JHD 1]